MKETTYDIIIVGGGISGLSLAYFLAQMDRKVLILEKSERVGGAIESFSYDNFHIDLGAHTAYNSYTTLLELAGGNTSKQYLQARKKQKYFFAAEKGFQKLTKPLCFTTILLNIPYFFLEKKEGKSVREYFSKVLGKKNYNNFARHFFKAVLSQESENYPAAFFLKRRNKRNKDFPKSFTFNKGMQNFSDTLTLHKNITILKKKHIQNIEKQGDNFLITTPTESWKTADIAFASYASEVSKLTKDIAPLLSQQLQRVKYQNVSSLGIIVAKNTIKNIKEFAGLLTSSDNYTSIVSRDIAPHEKYRGFTIHAQGKIPPSELKKLLCETLKIKPETIISQQYKNSYLPKLEKGHEDLLEDLEATIEKTRNIYVTGNYFQGLSLEDCLLRSKQEALRYISKP